MSDNFKGSIAQAKSQIFRLCNSDRQSLISAGGKNYAWSTVNTTVN